MLIMHVLCGFLNRKKFAVKAWGPFLMIQMGDGSYDHLHLVPWSGQKSCRFQDQIFAIRLQQLARQRPLTIMSVVRRFRDLANYMLLPATEITNSQSHHAGFLRAQWKASLCAGGIP
jgi:hypothetical protein